MRCFCRIGHRTGLWSNATTERKPFFSPLQSRKALFYRENRIQESGVRIQEKSGSCLFSWTGVTTASVMTIYRENCGQWAIGSRQSAVNVWPIFIAGGANPRHLHL
jgi:hypothetical protein